MISAYIFDLDGTLLDTELVWFEATLDYLIAQGHPISRESAMKIVYGRSWLDVYADIVTAFPDLDIGLENMQRDMAEYFYRRRDQADVLIHGSVELLKRLSQSTPCCIVSGSPREHIAEAIKIMDAAADITFYLGATDYPFGKPDPSGFLTAAARLGVSPPDCVVFEDSSVGIAAAKAAGMKAVALCQPFHPRQDIESADLILTDLSTFDPKVFD